MSELKFLSKAKPEARVVHRSSVREVIQRRSELITRKSGTDKNQYKDALSGSPLWATGALASQEPQRRI